MVALLDPASGPVLFAGRVRELRQLLEWCQDGSSRAPAVVTAPPGFGKTRLALHLAEELETLDPPWTTWLPPCDGEAAPAARLRAGDTPPRLLVVVDDADRRTPQAVADIVAAAQAAGQVKVLLLTGPGDGVASGRRRARDPAGSAAAAA